MDYYDAGNSTHEPTVQPAKYHNPVPISSLAVYNGFRRVGTVAGVDPTTVPTTRPPLPAAHRPSNR